MCTHPEYFKKQYQVMASTDKPFPADKGADAAADVADTERKNSAAVEEGSILEKAQTATSTYNATMSLDPVAERKLVWKFDLRLLPTLAVMYLFNALDKVSGFGPKRTHRIDLSRAT
jgi:hypothetical protein